MIRGYVVVVGVFLFSSISGCSVRLNQKTYGSRFYVRHNATACKRPYVKLSHELPPTFLNRIPANHIDVFTPVATIETQSITHSTPREIHHPWAPVVINLNIQHREATRVDDDGEDVAKSNIGWFAALTIILGGTLALFSSGFFIPVWMIGVASAFWLASLIVLLAGKKFRKHDKISTGGLVAITALGLIVLAVTSYILYHAIRLIVAFYKFIRRGDD